MEIVAFAQNYVVTFLIVLSVLVFVHEYGHFWVARRCGVKVEMFSIGFGKELWGWTDKHGTRWKVSLLPLGGYVKMFGDTDEASSGVEPRNFTPAEKEQAFFSKTVGQRAAIVVAGPAANYLFAIVVMALLFMLYGQPFTLPEAGEVAPDGAAYAAGMRAGDRIVAIDGFKIERFEQIQQRVALNTGTPSKFEIQRGQRQMTLTVTPKITEVENAFGDTHRTARIGISKSGVDVLHHTPVSALTTALGETWRITTGSLQALGQMISGTRSADELGGPLRIAQMSGKMAQLGVVELIWFMTLLSISLGLLNLFPIPLLDGGHLVYYAVEALRGRPLSEQFQEYAARSGFALLIGIMVFATWNDLVQLKIFSSLKQLFS
ncbi:MAG: RIP metalloprotease RseP [Bdellovibrionales bacterium]